jgi:serine protease
LFFLVFNNQGRFTASSLVAAMNECKNGGADIISMSLGGPVSSNAERRAVDDLTNDGILLVAAAGNSGNEDNPVEYPSSYDNVMSIAAMDSDSRIAAFSTHNTQVSVAGPGVKILSLTSSRTNSYSEFSGTSMATPHVAGVAALLMAKFPSKSAADIREALERSAIDFGACGKDRLHGHGLVDAMAAASFLETGQASPEQSNCKNTIITIKTDDWGAESSYVIVKDDDEDVIVYKGGPYPNEVRATYEDDIQLPEGCYRFIMLDSYGDGYVVP